MHLYTLGAHVLTPAHFSRLSSQIWMDSTGVSFVIEEAKIEGRKISYPYLLDEKGEPRLESTNDFLVWFCERCHIVTKITDRISTTAFFPYRA